MLEVILKKIIFLASDGAAVNCGKDSWLIRLIAGGFYLDFFYLKFQPSAKLTFKDALNDFIETVSNTELKNLYELL